MKLDKDSLIRYDYNIYTKKYLQINDDLLKEQYRNSEDLTYEKLKSWIEKGIFTRRLKFRNADENFYITTANIRRKSSESASTIEYKFYDDYLFSYWSGDNRAAALSNMEIGERSPANGTLDLIGNYEPHNNNLTNIKYETAYGKEFIKNAKNYIDGKEEVYNEKININEFFKLKFFLAQQGMQSKALRESDNCIIDGAAGTGKSTIAIQKLKFIFENSNIDQSKLCLVVRNENLISHFKTLLSNPEIDLPNIAIGTFDQLIMSQFDNLNKSTLEIIYKKFLNINKTLKNKLESSIENLPLLNEHYNSLVSHIGTETIKKQILSYLSILYNDVNKSSIEIAKNNLFDANNNLKIFENEHFSVIARLLNQKHDIETTLEVAKEDENEQDFKELEIELQRLIKEIESYDKSIRTFKSKIKSLRDRINKLEGLPYKKLLENQDFLNFGLSSEHIKDFSNDIETDELFSVLGWIYDYKKFIDKKKDIEKSIEKYKIDMLEEKKFHDKETLESKIKELQQDLKSEFKFSSREYTNKFKNVMKKVYFNTDYINNKPEFQIVENEKKIIFLYLEIVPKLFNTLIIDEAQEFSKNEIELAKLCSERIILTGDILQNSTQKFISKWDDLLTNDNNFKIHTLKHNFRQTFQLSQASFNFRKAILTSQYKEFNIEDLSNEYFESDKKLNNISFPKPEIRFIETENDLFDYYDDTMKLAGQLISQRIPLVVVFKSTDEKNDYKTQFRDYKISENLHDNQADIILIEVSSIKGNQFPIVMANLNNFNDKELYLIISRAQFALSLYSKLEDIDSRALSTILKIQQKNNSLFIISQDFQNKINFEKDYFEITDIEHSPIDKINKEIEPVNEDNTKNILTNDQNTTINCTLQSPNLLDSIEAHNKDIEKKHDEIDLSIIKDFDKYRMNAENKLKENLAKSNNDIKARYIKSKIKIGKEETKEFLKQQYKGHCQICGFTFDKKDRQGKYFERFSWLSEKITKQKTNLVEAGSSLCLCSKCHSILKYGDFEPKFIKEILKSNTKLSSFGFDKFCSFMEKNTEEITTPSCYDFIEIDMYKLPIRILNEDKVIFFTEEHLLLFYNMLSIAN